VNAVVAAMVTLGVQLYKLEAVFANISSTKGTAHGAWTFFAHC
jgi:hypothetical protein